MPVSDRPAVLHRPRAAAAASFLVAVAAGCTGSAPASSVELAPAPAPVPAGVDGMVAAYADSLARTSFVDLTSQEEATVRRQEGRALVDESDSLWRSLTATIDTPTTISEADSVAAAEAASTGGQALVELDRLLREGDDDTAALAARTAVLLDSAEHALETAHRLNPFDTRSQLWLSRVYELQARRLGQANAYALAIDELEKLSRLTPDDHTVFAMLANNYFHLEDWSSAATDYQRAEDVYLATYDLVVDTIPKLDSALIYSYARARADMRVRLLDAGGAVSAYSRALAYATTEADSVYIDGELAWIAWDDMNIAASVARDSLAALEEAGDLTTARRGYQLLLPALTAVAAINEVDWRLAIVDYNMGNGEAAAARLHLLVERIATDSTGRPVDAADGRYLDDYGAVCLNLARTLLHDQRDNRTALKYYEQATRIEWEGRAVAHLETATLLQTNVPAALDHATHALAREAELSVDQRKTLYRSLMDLYRRFGDFDRARAFRDRYRTLQNP